MIQEGKLLTISILSFLGQKYSMSKEQKAYLEHIKKHFNVSTTADFKVEEIEKINDINTIKSIYIITREFVFLRDNSCFTPEVFDYFPVSFIEQKRIIKEIYEKYNKGGLKLILEQYPIDVNKSEPTGKVKSKPYVNSDKEEYLRLGKAYLYGDGVPKNLEKAKNYLLAAVNLGSSEAIELLKNIGQNSNRTPTVGWFSNFNKALNNVIQNESKINYREALDKLILAQNAFESGQNIDDVMIYLNIAAKCGSDGAINILKLLPRAKKISISLAFKSAISAMEEELAKNKR